MNLETPPLRIQRNTNINDQLVINYNDSRQPCLMLVVL